MSVRNDHELPRSQADANDDAHLGTDQGPFEGEEALEFIVASLPVLAEHFSRPSPMNRRRLHWMRWKGITCKSH